ncbi:MAG: GDSL family lipase [Lentisphaerae bacterium]|jgi:lysophospholipase L1-like esterase|nr:GDSL family lipase [Lentisphaerota bacterium]MBT4820204.1 GDSL family lipase [Lentisphaerota bacterium]MBT5613229.1 GDSL family lipase [Lentisphaerota bacterium]MBT7062108.1 GDSL family lipase [Lentisphaerota bacterium]MBT7847620.1 GDSL family lipase [Lentisphaerota bacterium]
MQAADLSPGFFQGVVSVEEGDGWLKPWRLPHAQRRLFPTPDDGLLLRAEMASSTRLRLTTDSDALAVNFLPLGARPEVCEKEGALFDLTIAGEIVATSRVPVGGTEARFSGLPAGEKTLEVWLPPEVPISLTGVSIVAGATCRVTDDPRPKWVTYGSSLTHCVRANSTSRTWPAIVARKHGLNLTSLGFGGQCCLDPMVAFTIRDLPADVITLKLGINCIGGALSPRTFPGAVLGLVAIIREKHPTTPIGLVSPIGYPPHETTPNVVNYTITGMRRDIADVCDRLTEAGDENIFYYDGLQVFALDLIAEYTTDQCHPNGDGIEIMADNFDRTVMSDLVRRYPALGRRE